MRLYDSATDYAMVLEAARQARDIWLKPIADHLTANGIDWRKSYDTVPALDQDICRAWRELGYRAFAEPINVFKNS